MVGVAVKRLVGAALGLAVTGYLVRLGFGAPELEVTDFECTRTTMSDIVLTGKVKNISKQPRSLTARAKLIFVVDRGRPTRVEGPVRPEPLPAGESGGFEIRTQLPSRVPPMGKMDDGRSIAAADCHLESFTEKETGNPVNYKTPKTDSATR